MESLFLEYLSLWRPLGYLLIFAGVFVEGHIALIIIGFLVAGGRLGVIEAFLAVFFSTLVSDAFWFWFGRTLGRRGQGKRWAEYAQRVLGRFDSIFKRMPGRAILYTKFIYGTYRASLIRIGMLGVERSRFFIFNIAASAIWIVVWGGISYVVGRYFIYLKEYMRYIEVGMVLSVLVVVALEWGMSKWIAKRLEGPVKK